MSQSIPRMQMDKTYRQPAGMANTVLLYTMPQAKEDKDCIATVIPHVYVSKNDADIPEKKRPVGYQPRWALSTRLDTMGTVDARVNFKGSWPQIYALYRQVYCERIGARVFEGDMTPLMAEDAVTQFDKHIEPPTDVQRETPLFVTTNTIFMPKTLTDDATPQHIIDVANKYYAQDWKEGLARAESYLTDDEAEDEMFAEIIDALHANKYDTIHPASFFAVHSYRNLSNDEHAMGYSDVWDICSSEPHALRYITSLISENAVHMTLSFLQDGFQQHIIQADPAMEAAQQFNPLHFNNVFDDQCTYLEGVKKSHIMDALKRSSGLS